jgi:DNA invertase Pin-like site-specific DNA recombinase
MFMSEARLPVKHHGVSKHSPRRLTLRDDLQPLSVSPEVSHMPTALYLRESTGHRKSDLQAEALRRYAASTGLEVVAEYVDVAGSGCQEMGPQLQALMHAACQQVFTCVLVWKFDCFARSISHLLRTLEAFQQLGIRFISVQDHVDTAYLMGQTLVTLIGATAALESALLSERIKAGMVAAKAQGKRLGRPATPDHLVGHIETLAQTTEMSIRQIHQTLAGRVSRSVVGQIVKRVREAGKTSHGDRWPNG